MDPHLQSLIHYISAHRQHGSGDDKIRSELLGVGWPEHMINQAFAVLDAQQATAQGFDSHDVAIGSSHSPQPLTQSTSVDAQMQNVPHNSDVIDQTTRNAPSQQQQSPAISNSETVPQKYTIHAALADVWRGFKSGWKLSLSTIFIVLLVAMAAIVIPVFSISLVSSFLMGRHQLTTGNSLIISIIVLPLAMLVMAAMNSALLSAVVLTIRDGLNQTATKLSDRLKEIQSRIIPLIGASAILYLITVGPLFLLLISLIIISIGLLASGDASSSIALLIPVFMVVAGLACLVWMIIAVLRYGLVPVIVLLEPELGVWGSFKRSRFLLVHGGQWFICKGLLVLFVIEILLSALSGGLDDKGRTDNNPFVIFVQIVMTFTVYGVVYALYRNRVAVKGTDR